MEMKTKRHLPKYVLTMFRNHDSHGTKDIEGAAPANKMLSYAEKARIRLAIQQTNSKPARDLTPPLFSKTPEPAPSKKLFPVTPMGEFLFNVHKQLGKPPIARLKRYPELRQVLSPHLRTNL
jgi:hypothetical protein